MTFQKAADQYSDYRVRNKITSDNDEIWTFNYAYELSWTPS